jgi:hypothetical protein
MTTTGKNRIMIFGPKADGTYVEFRTADLIELNGDDLRQSKQDHHLHRAMLEPGALLEAVRSRL